MKDTHLDVAILGSGITALTAAVLLSERGRRVAVIRRESHDIGDEITVAGDVRYHFLRRRFGNDAARLVADAGRAAAETIAGLVQRYAIDCRFRRVPAYLYTEKRRHVAELKSEAAAAREAGLDAQYVTEVPLPFETRGGVLFPDQAQFDGHAYVAELAKHVTIVDQDVRADAVFDTTPPAESSWHRVDHIAYAGKGDEGLFRDTADPPHCTRRDGAQLIVSGENIGDYARDYHVVRAELRRWSTTVVKSRDGLPLIGRANGRYTAGAYGNQSATFGTLAAMIVADWIAGTESPWSKLAEREGFEPSVEL